MKQEFAMLAHHAEMGGNYVGWYASRKLDGWGCVWDGGVTTGMNGSDVPWNYVGADDPDRKATGLWTIGRADKYGIKPKIISAPEEFINQLPKGIPLHGELWKDDDRDFVQSVCSKLNPVLSEWKKIIFYIYNVKPYECWIKQGLNWDFQNNVQVENQAWLDRMKEAHEVVNKTEQVEFLPQYKIEQENDLDALWAIAKEEKWEGLCLINPFSKYETERSHSLLKMKTEYDTEAYCISWTEGKGRHVGRVGALICKLIWGEKVSTIKGGSDELIGKEIIFKVAGGLSDKEREFNNVESKYIDKWLKIKFNGLAGNGRPPSASITGETFEGTYPKKQV